MATVRMTLDEIEARAAAGQVAVDRAKLAATTEEDIAGYSAEDGDMLEAEGYQPVVNVAEVRRLYGMSQGKFAAMLGVPVGTLRNWEQGRTTMDPAVRTLFRVVAREPEAVRRALETPA